MKCKDGVRTYFSVGEGERTEGGRKVVPNETRYICTRRRPTRFRRKTLDTSA